MVNSPQTQVHLLGWDFDATDDAKGHKITCDVYFDCFWSRWDHGGKVYIEPSRNRRGRYIWTIVERTSSPAEFNLLVNALSRALRKRFRLDHKNKFDAIKGTLHYDDRDDLERLFAEADGDINDNHRGVLVTMPLAGSLARSGFEDHRDAFLRFARKVKRKVARRSSGHEPRSPGVPVPRGGHTAYENSIPESHLWELLSLYDQEELERLHKEINSRRPQPSVLHPLAPTTAGNDLRMSAPLAGRTTGGNRTRERLRDKAHAEINGKNRMRLVSSLFYYTHRAYAPSAEALVAFYKDQGFAKGEDSIKKDGTRLKRARDALDHHRGNPAKMLRGFDRDYWSTVIIENVRDDHRQDQNVRYRSPRTHKVMLIENDLLAAGLYTLTISAFGGTGDRRHTCSQEGQLAMYSKLSTLGLLTASFSDKRKRVAVPIILQNAGLVLPRSNWQFGGPKEGWGKGYGLGPRHPQYSEFIATHGHVEIVFAKPSLLPSQPASPELQESGWDI